MTLLAGLGGMAALFGFIPVIGETSAEAGPTCPMLGGSGLAIVFAIAVAAVL